MSLLAGMKAGSVLLVPGADSFSRCETLERCSDLPLVCTMMSQASQCQGAELCKWRPLAS